MKCTLSDVILFLYLKKSFQDKYYFSSSAKFCLDTRYSSAACRATCGSKALVWQQTDLSYKNYLPFEKWECDIVTTYLGADGGVWVGNLTT